MYEFCMNVCKEIIYNKNCINTRDIDIESSLNKLSVK